MIEPKILVLCVNYNRSLEVLSLAKQFERLQGREGLDFLVIDNSDKQNEKDILASSPHPEFVTVITPSKNLGYFKGAHFGFQNYLLKNSKAPKWTVVCNTDIEIHDLDFLKKLDSLGSIPVVAPAVISTGFQLDQNPHLLKRVTKTRLQVCRLLYRYAWIWQLHDFVYRTRLLIKKQFQAQRVAKAEGGQKIYAPHGAFVLFNQSYFNSGGTLNYAGFVYGEEIFVAELCRKHNLEVSYRPELRVYHREHSAIGTLPKGHLANHAVNSLDYLLKQFFYV